MEGINGGTLTGAATHRRRKEVTRRRPSEPQVTAYPTVDLTRYREGRGPAEEGREGEGSGRDPPSEPLLASRSGTTQKSSRRCRLLQLAASTSETSRPR